MSSVKVKRSSVKVTKSSEGDEHIRRAEKALKTSLTKWSPDLDSAADEFSKAATCFTVANCFSESLAALDRACDCYKQCKSSYQAATMLEQAVFLCRESGRLDLVLGLAERGGLLYRQHGSPESAAQLLEKAARIVESKSPEEALELYQKAAETVMVEDRPKQAAEYMVKVGRLQVKTKYWDRAAETLESTIKLMQDSADGGESSRGTGRLVCALVLVQLAREDVVGAAKAFSAWGGYCDLDQTIAVNSILNGFNDENADEVRRGLASGAIRNLDIEFAVMARDIRLPKGGLEAAAPTDCNARRAAFRTSSTAATVALSATAAAVTAAAAASATAAVSSPLRGTAHTFGVDPVHASDFGETREQREEEGRLQKDQDDEEELC